MIHINKILYHRKVGLLLLFLWFWNGNFFAQPYAYVACTNTNNVKKVNTASSSFNVVATINVGDTPHGTAVTPDGSKVYVTNSIDNTVSVISTATDAITATINVGNYPFGIIASPDGSKVYVGNNGTNTVSVIDVATDAVVNTITVGTGPYGLAMSPDGYILYVANRFDNTVSMVLEGSSSAYATINVGTSPRGLKSSVDGKQLFVLNNSSKDVSVIDVINATVDTTFSVGNNPHDLAVTTNGNTIIVSNTGSGSLTSYSTTDYSLQTVYSMPTPKGISILPNGTQFVVFSSLSNLIRLFNVGSQSLQGSANLGTSSFPAGLGNFVFTPSSSSIDNLFPIFKGGNGQGYAANEVLNNSDLFAGGNGQGYAADEVQNMNDLFAGGNGQGYAADEVLNNNNLFQGGNGQGYSMDEIVPITWTGNVDNDWLEPNNWSSNSIPTVENGVKILAGSSNYPVLTTGILGVKENIGVDYTCKNIFIDKNANLSLETGTQIINKGNIQIQGSLNHRTDLNDAFYNSDGAKVVIKSNGVLSIYDAVNQYEFPDLIFDNATLEIDTGTVEIADILKVTNNSSILANAATITTKKVGKGSDEIGFQIDATSSMTIKGTIESGGQNPTSVKKAIDWDNNAIIDADSAKIKFIQPTANNAALANNVNVDFGGKKVLEIEGASSGYIYPHFQDDVEVAGDITIGANDKFYQDNGTIEIEKSLKGQGEFIGTNGIFKMSGIDFCDVDIRNEFNDLIIEKTNGGSVTATGFPIKVKNDLDIVSGDFNVNEMTTKPDVDIDGDLKIRDGALMTFFGYQMKMNISGSYLNSNMTPGVGGFQNFGLEGAFTFDGSGTYDICAGNTTQWGDTVKFINGGIYNMKSQLDLTNTILSIVGGKISVDNDTMVLNQFSLNGGYGANNYIITDGTGAIQVNGIGSGDTLNIPVGVDSISYTPVKIINTGTTDDFLISAKKGVKSNGTTGSDITNGIVDVTWEVEEVNVGGSDVEMIFEWTAADEKVGFNRNIAKVFHYKNGQWIQENSDPVQGTDPYTMSVKNITSFSPFTVGNQNTALPVECLSFTATNTENGILLKWSTATEENNDYFDLERSKDGIHFEKIGSVQGNGTTYIRSDYEFQESPFLDNSIYYYRLKQVDFNGEFEYACDIISIRNTGLLNIEISNPFPNPTTDVTTIRIHNAKVQTIDVQLFDSNGKLVYSELHKLQIGKEDLRIDLSTLTAGEYQLVIEMEHQKHFVGQVIKL